MKQVNKTPKIEKFSIVLRVLILASGIYQVFFGETGIGLVILLSFLAITIPAFFSRGFIKKFPIEIEILLFIMVLLQFILGEARDFYVIVPYYDKIVHYLLPMFLGVIGFIIFYTLQATGRLKTTMSAMMLIIILITLGVGAFWEIIEYSSDVIFYPRIPGWHHFQGNDQQNALDDTMTDLIIDTLGGIFGAFLGLWYMRKATREGNARLPQLVSEVTSMFSPKKPR